jgi:hypothetical protein
MKVSIKDVCNKCGAMCCRAGIIAATGEEHKAIVEAGFEDHFKKEGKIFFIINHNSVCPYLKGSACTVYELRPSICRCWPVHPLFRNGKHGHHLYTCPLSKHLTEKDLEGLKGLALDVPKEICLFVEKWDKKFGLSEVDRKMGWGHY